MRPGGLPSWILVVALGLATSCTCRNFDPQHYVSGLVEIELAREPPAGPMTLAGVQRATDADMRALADALTRLGAQSLTPSLGSSMLQEIPAIGTLPPGQRPPSPRQILSVRFPSTTNLCRAARGLEATGIVVRAAPVPRMISPQTAAPDPYLGNAINDRDLTPCGTEWFFWRTKVPAAWDMVDLGAPVVVAVIDQGFRLDHPELTPVVDPTYRYRPCENDSAVGPGSDADRTGHGTSAAGLVATPKDGGGQVGASPGATIWPVQVTCVENEANGVPNPWASAIEWVIRQTGSTAPKVVLLEAQTESFYSCEESVAIQNAIKRAVAAKVPVVVPAGNGGHDVKWSSLKTKIHETGSILVGATTYGSTGNANPRYSLSNHGKRVAVSAPGDPTPSYGVALAADGSACRGNFGMTSAAGAHVAGVVALMLRAKPELTPAEIKKIFKALPKGNISNLGGKKMGRFLIATTAVEEAKK